MRSHAINYNDTLQILERNTTPCWNPHDSAQLLQRTELRRIGTTQSSRAGCRKPTPCMQDQSLWIHKLLMFPFEDVEWAVEKISAPEVNHPGYKDIILNANVRLQDRELDRTQCQIWLRSI